jgi:hypothetical protein
MQPFQVSSTNTVVADFLSQLTINDDNPVDDSFPDEYLFAVSAHSPWYADIATRWTPQCLSNTPVLTITSIWLLWSS